MVVSGFYSPAFFMNRTCSSHVSETSEELKTIRNFAIIFALFIGIPALLSGVWPPYVSILSGSMEPNMEKGDFVFVLDDDRALVGESPHEGVSTHREGKVNSFGDSGNVIIYEPNGSERTPIIHRSRFWVTEGENWFSKANETYMTAQNCEQLRNCPAPNSGYITLGDANQRYDQSIGFSSPVKPDWIVGTAKLRIPLLGWITIVTQSIFDAVW